MKFTDIFIRRPVLSIVISLVLLVLGLRSFGILPVFQFPRTQNAVITVTTTYFGADPDLVAGFITTPLENAIAQVNGIDYMNSTSTNSSSIITVTLKLNYDPDKALTEMNAQITSVLNALPPQTQKPVMTISIGQTLDAMYIGFYSKQLPPNYITDYLLRVVQPKLQTVPGVQTAELLGAKNFALRAWLDPKKLAAYGLTPADVSNAMIQNDFLSGVGNTKGLMVQTNLSASTNLHSLDEFRNLIIRQSGNAMVRLQDVANVTLGADNYDSAVAFDGQSAVFIGIQVAPTANLLDVVKRVREVMPDI
ncbi:MAG TPA: efflux RND transporter permease subunit, partial [Gallionellaceae bacterium]|nr:efflux RND transporter permease subunit [Gallionellaceae bacterium]